MQLKQQDTQLVPTETSHGTPNKLYDSYYDTMPKWVAQYYSSCTYKGKYDMWQYSSDGAVTGIAGRVDMNYDYTNLANICGDDSSSGTIANDDNNDVIYQVYTTDWLSNVTGESDYAGIPGKQITRLTASINSGSIQYQVHTVGGDWLPWVTDRTDFAGYSAGDKAIDAIRAKLVDTSKYSLQLRVAPIGGEYYSWVTDDNDYAGSYGKAIDKVQMRLIKKLVEQPVVTPPAVEIPAPVVEEPVVEPIVETPPTVEQSKEEVVEEPETTETTTETPVLKLEDPAPTKSILQLIIEIIIKLLSKLIKK